MRFKKSDIIATLILGEMVALLSWPILKNTGLDKVLNSYLKIDISLGLLIAALPMLALFAVYIFFTLSKIKPVFFQIGKFAAVGSANTLVDWGVLNLLVFVTGVTLGLGPSLFKIISFIAATTNSYAWNKFWTFTSGKSKQKTETLKFFLISGVGVAINIGIFSFVVNVVPVIGSFSNLVWLNIAAVVATFFSMVWNFVGYKYLVFKSKIKN